MHASLIFLVASLAASVVAAPVPNVSPVESPEPLVVREVEILKREILERLDAIVKRDDHSLGVGVAHDKRGHGQNYGVANDKRGHGQNYGAANDKRGHSENYQAANDKRGHSENYQAANDKRGHSENYQAANDKRGHSENYQAANDKCESDNDIASLESDE